MSISNSLISALLELTFASKSLPSGVDFGLASLEDGFDQKIEEIQQQIFEISKNKINFRNINIR